MALGTGVSGKKVGRDSRDFVFCLNTRFFIFETAVISILLEDSTVKTIWGIITGNHFEFVKCVNISSYYIEYDAFADIVLI